MRVLTCRNLPAIPATTLTGNLKRMTITPSDIVILVILLVIVVSLFSGLYYMLHDRGQSMRTVKALTVRITISLILFALLMIGYWTGWLHPHGLLPPHR